MRATSSKLQHAVRKGVHDTGCARVLHLPAAQQLMTQKASQAGSLVATAVGVQYSQNAEMWQQLEQLCFLLHAELPAVGKLVCAAIALHSCWQTCLSPNEQFCVFHA